MKKQLGIVDIPLDIIVAVLSFLPVKTLARFRCVSKEWLTLIHSPHFVSKHKSVHAHKLIYLIIKHPSVFPWDTFFDNKPPLPDLLESSSLLSFSSNRYISFHGSCNGLVLFSLSEVTRINYRPDFFNRDRSLFIWNPSTNKLKAVDICTDFDVTSIYSYGFGSCIVDGGVDEYKVVVKLLRFPFDLPPIVYVYTLSTHSWKRIVVDTASSSSHLIHNMSVSINGILYWVGNKYSVAEDHPRVIISFDLQREVFGGMALPKGIDSMNRETNWLVGNYRKFLSLVSQKPESTILSVWVMKEYGVDAECWEKLFVVSIAPTLVLNSYFGTRVSMVDTCDSSHSVFDTESQQWIQLGDNARQLKNLHFSHFSAIAYNESLVSLDEKMVVIV